MSDFQDLLDQLNEAGHQFFDLTISLRSADAEAVKKALSRAYYVNKVVPGEGDTLTVSVRADNKEQAVEYLGELMKKYPKAGTPAKPKTEPTKLIKVGDLTVLEFPDNPFTETVKRMAEHWTQERPKLGSPAPQMWVGRIAYEQDYVISFVYPDKMRTDMELTLGGKVNAEQEGHGERSLAYWLADDPDVPGKNIINEDMPEAAVFAAFYNMVKWMEKQDWN